MGLLKTAFLYDNPPSIHRKGRQMKVIMNSKEGKKDREKDSGGQDVVSFIDGLQQEDNLEQWSGTLREYLPMVIEDPKLNDSAHAYMWRMIAGAGIEYDKDDEKKEKPRYKFFESELFGIDDTIRETMEYFDSAARGSDVSRRLLLLFGPTSSGKSEFAILLKNGLEKFSRTHEGRVFAIDGCPMNGNPLCAIPKHMRSKIREQYGLHIEGDVSPPIQWKIDNELDGDFWKLPVKRIFFSEMNRVGIGTFQPADPKNQNQSELSGSLNYARVTEYGSEAHPLAYDFNGELNIANRGLMEFIELLKVDRKFRYILLTLAQEKRIKSDRFPLVHADEVLLSHTNETEYKKFQAQQEEEALHDRIIVTKFPYNLVLNDEIRIYEKLISRTPGFQSVHIAPHTLCAAAMFAVLSRLEDPKDVNIGVLKKMRLYNNEDVDGVSDEDKKRLRQEAEREGMEGISPRYIINRLAVCFTKHGATYISPIDALRSIKDGFSTNAKLAKEDIDGYEDLISKVIEEYNKIARNEVQKAFFLNFEGEIKNLLNNYIDNALADLNEDKVKNEWGDFEEPDYRLLRSVEEKIGITESGAEAFRQEVTRKMLTAKAENGEYDYRAHARLREALQEQLFAERSDVIRLTVSVRNPDPDALKRLNEVIKTLVDQHGYTPESANELLRYVSNIMSRNS